MSEPTPLEHALRRLIAAEGPMGVGHFMALCLYDPRHGYYMRRDPFGAAGDFTTAPEISQMFGELLGLWAVGMWQRMGSPDPVLLVEFGPGRGTLMADALRATRVAPAFRAAVRVHLVEISPQLRRRQEQTLAGSGVPVAWHENLSDAPKGPLIAIANEFFDALPVFQYVKTASGWHERLVGLGEDAGLTFALSPSAAPHFEAALPASLRGAPPGVTFERRSDAQASELSARIVSDGGAALAIDYGHSAPGFGDTLQAVRKHAFVSPLETPGESDLTAHVDFAALAMAAQRAGAQALGPLRQGDFLRGLGIEERAARLKSTATPLQRAAIDAALTRLTGSEPEHMGGLFKALVIADPKLGLDRTDDRSTKAAAPATRTDGARFP